MKRLFLFLLALTFGIAPVAADESIVQAQPALWHVRGKDGGEAWLFGSIHVMPPNIEWQTPAVEKAVARADVFVFEVPTDAATMDRMRDMVVAHGYLPPGTSLRAMLPAAAQAELDAALEAAGLPLAAVDHDRPWLASLQIAFAQLAKSRYSADSGVDVLVQKQAGDREKRYFETIEQQFALLAPDDETLEMNQFASDLKDLAKADSEIETLVAAWARGDVPAIADLMNMSLDDYPDAKAALLTDRNKRWALQIAAMLKEKHRFFITVGAGHLAGADSVPALLRQAGYRVDGPQ